MRDLRVHGGTVLTMDPQHTVKRCDVVVRDGQFAHLGKRDTSASSDDVGAVDALDAHGCAVVPGLVQAHVHLCQALFRGMADDLPLLPWLQQRIWPLEAAHDPASVRASARLGLLEMMKAGTTTVLDMGTVHHQDVIFEVMHECGIRGFSGKAMMDRGRGVPKGLKETTRESLTQAEALCRRWHRTSPRGLVGYAFAPRFLLSCTKRLLRRTVALAADADAIIHSHAAEHPEERKAVWDAYGEHDIAALQSCGISGSRVVLAHGVQLTRREMRRAARAGTRFVHCPSANLKLGSGIADVVEMRRAGLTVALGADGAPCNNRMDPWTELRQAALLAKVRTHRADALTASDAFSLATSEGAAALGLKSQVGSIEVGKRADFAVIRLDRPHCEPGGTTVGRLVYSGTASDVRHVVIDGRIVVKDGQHQLLDEARVLADARRHAQRVARRAGLA